MSGDQTESKQQVAHESVDVLTEQDVVTVAQRVTGDKSVSVLKHEYHCYSQEALGALGSHRILIITIKTNNNNIPKEINFFVKSVPYKNAYQAEFITSQGIFVKESLLFKKVIPFLTENYSGDKWAPACYITKKDVIVMENLKSQGYRIFDRLYNNLAAIKSVLATLARFHSCSILAEARLKQKGNSLDQYCPDSLNEIMFNPNAQSSVWVQASIKTAATVAESYGHDFQKVRTACNKIYELILPSTNHCNVIGHGDLWMNNIMIDDHSEPYKCILVDFQLARYAPLVIDILQFLHINSSRDFRQKYERILVEYYHSILQETIRSNDSTGQTKILTINEILKGLDDYRLFGAIIACFYRLLGPKVGTECAKSPEKYAKFLAGDVIDVLQTFMDKNELFKNQVDDAISELAEISQ